MKSTLTKLALTSALIMSSSLMALEIDVKITNLTSGVQFTPVLVTAHPASAKLYTTGSAASANLKAMAEGGDTSGLKTALDTAGANSMENIQGGLLQPGANAMTSISTTSGNDYLSVVAMMLPTNDGFIGLNSIKIPTTPGTYKYILQAHDAGTEANDELAASIPNPGGAITSSGATGITATAEGFVHIHRGNIGDSDASGGLSDLDAGKHRFLNPVASVTITVN